MVKSQLIVLGNGFDLDCGLKSSFSDYLAPRFSRFMNAIVTMSSDSPRVVMPEELLRAISLARLTIWDEVLFSYSKLTRGLSIKDSDSSEIRTSLCSDITDTRGKDEQLEHWSDVEGRLDFMTRHSTNSGSAQWYSQICKHLNSGERRPPRLREMGIEARYIFQSLGEEACDKTAFDKFLLSELRRFEGDFRRHLLNSVGEKTDYPTVAEKRLGQIADDLVGVSGEGDLRPSTAVLSFNYTRPSGESLSRGGVSRYVNIHGTLDDDNIIMGVDGRLPSVLSKKSRREAVGLRQDVGSLAIAKKADGAVRPVDVIKVFGHSLCLSDYPYYEQLFDAVDLVAGGTKIIFYALDIEDGDGDDDKRTEEKRKNKKACLSSVRELLTEYFWRRKNYPTIEEIKRAISAAEVKADELMAGDVIVVRDSRLVQQAG